MGGLFYVNLAMNNGDFFRFACVGASFSRILRVLRRI